MNFKESSVRVKTKLGNAWDVFVGDKRLKDRGLAPLHPPKETLKEDAVGLLGWTVMLSAFGTSITLPVIGLGTGAMLLANIAAGQARSWSDAKTYDQIESARKNRKQGNGGDAPKAPQV